MSIRRADIPQGSAEAAGRPAAPPAKGRHRAWQAGWVLLAAAAAFAGWSGWSYWQAGHGGAVAAGRLRDQVLQAATRDIADLNTVNDRQIGVWEARWLADTTGAEHAQVQRTNGAARAQILQVRTSSRAAVTAAAVTGLNQQAGTAQVIAVVRVVQTADSGGEDTISNRYLADLVRTGGGWKISSITPG
jgi:Mce-associated membrane protein